MTVRQLGLSSTYEYSNPGMVDVLPWTFPDSQSAFLEEPVCEYASLHRDSQPVYPNLGGTLPWPGRVSFPAPLTGMSFGPGASPLSPDTWAGETDSDGCDQEGFSPLSDSPDARLQPSWSEDSAIPPAADSIADTSNPRKRKTSSSSNQGHHPQHGRKHSVQLRTASRKPRHKPSSSASSKDSTSPSSPTTTKCSPSPLPDDDLTPEERRARRNHNLVEKQYRNRLNAQFERLLAVLPVEQCQRSSSSGSGGGGMVGAGDEKRMSKAEVLDLATRRIRTLEVERDRLVRERREMVRRMQVMMMGGGGAHGGGTNVRVPVGGLGLVGPGEGVVRM